MLRNTNPSIEGFLNQPTRFCFEGLGIVLVLGNTFILSQRLYVMWSVGSLLRGDFFPSPFPPGDKRSLALFFVVVALVLAFVTFPPVFLPFGVYVPFCGVF